MDRVGAMTPPAPRVLVLGTADWDQAIATNQHYAVRELSKTAPVVFVQSMGLRRPELRWRDVSRIVRRMIGMVRRSDTGQRRPVPSGVTVVSPLVLPWHRGPVSWFNRISLRRQLRFWTEGPGPKVLWLYSPVDYGLSGAADGVVYHCVDLLGTVNGIDSRVIHSAERRLAASGRVLAAGSSPVVVEHLAEEGFTTPRLWPNVADVEVFLEAAAESQHEPAPAAVFAGNMTTTKVDFEALQALVERGVSLHLAGPVAEGGGDARREVNALVRGGATYHGLLDLPALARLCARCSVGLIPYVVNNYTAGVSPLKTYEYLASGLKVVSTGVPSVEAVTGHVVVTSPAGFVDEVTRSCGEGPPTAAQRTARQDLASQHSWIARGEEMRRTLQHALAVSPGGIDDVGAQSRAE